MLSSQVQNFSSGRQVVQSDIVNFQLKEFVLSVLEYQLCTTFSAFNIHTGELFITQLIDSPSYESSVYLLNRYFPIYIITQQSCQNSIIFSVLKDEFPDALFYVFDNNYFLDVKYKDIFHKVLNKYPELKNLTKSKQALHQNCLAGLLNFVTTQLKIQVNLQFTQINLIRLTENLYYDKKTFTALNIYHQSNDVPCLFKNFTTLTSGGNRLLRGTLIQPLCNIDQIIQRESHLQDLLSVSNGDKHMIKNLQEILRRFRHLDSISLQLSQVHNFKKQFDDRCKQVKDMLGQILKINDQVKNLNNLSKFLQSNQIENYFNEYLKQLLFEEEPQEIKRMINESLDENILQTILPEINCKKKKEKDTELCDEKFLFMVRDDQNQLLHQSRRAYSQLMNNLRNLLNTYKKLLKCDDIQFKIIHKIKETIIGLKNGYMLIVSQKSKLTEQQIRKKLTSEFDSVQIIECKGGNLQILTDNLAEINLKILQASQQIFDQTSLQIFQLYINIQQETSGWIFKVNSYISYLDLITSFADYAKEFQPSQITFPCFNNSFEINESKAPKQQQFSIELSKEQNTHMIYDLQDSFSDLLTQIGQMVIMAQIGCFLPCKSYKANCFNQLFTKLRNQTKQNLQENQSSFTSEIKQLYNILTRLQNQKLPSLVLCDELVLSSSHEENIALNLVFVERIDQIIRGKDIRFICCTNQADNLSASKLSQNIEILLAQKNIVKSIRGTELEQVLNEENNEEYNREYIEKLEFELNLPKIFCQLMASKLQAQQKIIGDSIQIKVQIIRKRNLTIIKNEFTITRLNKFEFINNKLIETQLNLKSFQFK